VEAGVEGLMSYYCPRCKRKYRYTHEGNAVCATKGCPENNKPKGVTTRDYGGYDG
jgi:hypothetical protein